MKKGLMKVAKAETSVGIDIGLNPKYQYNGSLVAKFRIGKGQTTIPQGSTSQAIGGGNGLPLTDNAEGEEIVYARLEKE